MGEVTGSADDYTTKSFMIIPLTKRYSGDHVKNNEMNEACFTYERQEKCIKGFGGAP